MGFFRKSSPPGGTLDQEVEMPDLENQLSAPKPRRTATSWKSKPAIAIPAALVCLILSGFILYAGVSYLMPGPHLEIQPGHANLPYDSKAGTVVDPVLQMPSEKRDTPKTVHIASNLEPKSVVNRPNVVGIETRHAPGDINDESANPTNPNVRTSANSVNKTVKSPPHPSQISVKPIVIDHTIQKSSDSVSGEQTNSPTSEQSDKLDSSKIDGSTTAPYTSDKTAPKSGPRRQETTEKLAGLETTKASGGTSGGSDKQSDKSGREITQKVSRPPNVQTPFTVNNIPTKTSHKLLLTPKKSEKEDKPSTIQMPSTRSSNKLSIADSTEDKSTTPPIDAPSQNPVLPPSSLINPPVLAIQKSPSDDDVISSLNVEAPQKTGVADSTEDKSTTPPIDAPSQNPVLPPSSLINPPVLAIQKSPSDDDVISSLNVEAPQKTGDVEDEILDQDDASDSQSASDISATAGSADSLIPSTSVNNNRIVTDGAASPTIVTTDGVVFDHSKAERDRNTNSAKFLADTIRGYQKGRDLAVIANILRAERDALTNLYPSLIRCLLRSVKEELQSFLKDNHDVKTDSKTKKNFKCVFNAMKSYFEEHADMPISKDPHKYGSELTEIRELKPTFDPTIASGTSIDSEEATDSVDTGSSKHVTSFTNPSGAGFEDSDDANSKQEKTDSMPSFAGFDEDQSLGLPDNAEMTVSGEQLDDT
eukprot:851344_1